MRSQRKPKAAPLATLIMLAVVIQVPPPWPVVTSRFPGVGTLSPVAQADQKTGYGRRHRGELQDADADGNADGEVIATIVSANVAEAHAVARRHRLTVMDDLEEGLWLFGIPDSRSVKQVVNQLSEDPDVGLAQPNRLQTLPEIDQRSQVFVDQRSQVFVDGQSPPDYFGQYAMQLMRATEAQAMAAGHGVTVAVIDTGVDMAHPVFRNQIQVWPKSDYVSNDDDPSEEGQDVMYGHGTMVAGLIALVAPQAIIVPLRAFDCAGRGKTSDVSKAIREAARQGADIINMSFSVVPSEAGPIRSAISYALSRGVVLVAAAGNDGSSVPFYPAAEPDVLAVGATDPADEKAVFSNYGSHLDVGAPGVGIYSAYPDGQYGWGDGTSYAASLASGVAAVVISHTRAGVIEAIKNTAVPCCGGMLGNGRIDALAAVSQ